MSIDSMAVEYHGKGLNCAQSVLCACSEYTGLDYDRSVAVAAGFGGGLRCGEICGAASGAVMAVGLFLAKVGVENLRAESTSLTTLFIDKFKEQFGVVRCQELKSNRVPCDELIAFSAKTVEEILINYK